MRSDYFLDWGRNGNYDVSAGVRVECMHCDLASDHGLQFVLLVK